MPLGGNPSCVPLVSCHQNPIFRASRMAGVGSAGARGRCASPEGAEPSAPKVAPQLYRDIGGQFPIRLVLPRTEIPLPFHASQVRRQIVRLRIEIARPLASPATARVALPRSFSCQRRCDDPRVPATCAQTAGVGKDRRQAGMVKRSCTRQRSITDGWRRKRKPAKALARMRTPGLWSPRSNGVPTAGETT